MVDSRGMTLAAVDYLILALYFVFVLSIGWVVKSKVSTDPNAKPYTGYRAGMTLVEGGWRFAYFVNN